MSKIADCQRLATEMEGTRYAGWKLHHVLVDQMADGRAYLEFIREQQTPMVLASRAIHVRTTAMFADENPLYELLTDPNCLERLVDGV